jgi:hypothetical protein
LCVAVLGVLLSGSLALAAGRRYVGKVKPVGTVKVVTGLKNGHRVVKRFFVSVPMHCRDWRPGDGPIPPAIFDTAQGLASGDDFPTVPISYRQFHIRVVLDVRGPVIAVKGWFNPKFTRATGTVSFDGLYYPWTNCHTGRATWTAN